MTMLAKFDGVKMLKLLIKLAAVALTSPATISVASSLYPNVPIVRTVVSVAALILVEGCLLLGWQTLDQQGKQAAVTQRWLYAGLMWIAYLSLFGIALYHNEGLAGLMFRLTLSVVLVYTPVEAGLLASIRTEDQADRDIFKDWHVKRYARKLARRSAMADLDLTFTMRQLDRQAQEKVYTLHKERQTQQQVRDVKSAHVSSNPNGVEKAKFDSASLDQANTKRKLSKRAAMDRTLRILTDDPTINLTDIARKIGRSRQTVYDYLDELETAGKLHRNGSINVIS
jgi:hypothetical protein